MTEALAVYIHWPYCVSKCPYCDFNSHVAAAPDHEAWRAAYRRALGHYAALLPGRRVTSVFFGGGTPSLMQPQTVAAILDDLARHWQMEASVEITLEANPNSAEAEKFAAFRNAGVNRLSLGVQSLNDEALAFLGRAHGATEARRAIALADRHFPRFSFDLIYARKDQSPAAWERELNEALELAGGHLSLYQLTIEPNTQFHTRAGRGEPLTAAEPEAAGMFERTQEILAARGLPAYEISNHARPGEESRHNLTYWRYEDYIGIGPGAHGRFRDTDAGVRLAAEDHRAPEVWLTQVKEKGHGIRLNEAIDAPTAQREALMMGLRLAEGIDLGNWRAKFGVSLEDALAADKMRRLRDEGYLALSATALAATKEGRQRLNALLAYLAA
jgi:oxygen-independent coproporphyrinogen-3 oxidase